jgi:iron only hydrogenase large subunit-like protein
MELVISEPLHTISCVLPFVMKLAKRTFGDFARDLSSTQALVNLMTQVVKVFFWILQAG